MKQVRQEERSAVMQRESADRPSDPTKECDVREGGDPLDRLKGVVLLSGSVRTNRLTRSIGASLLDLPIDARHSVLDLWYKQVADLAGRLDRPSLPVRVMLDHTSPVPTAEGWGDAAEFTIERDPYDYRGTGGVLRDLSVDYAEDEYLLVANGAQVLLEPLSDLAETLASASGDVGLVAHRDGTPSGLILVRCGALDAVSPTGFVDLKEQALPAIVQKHRVCVVHRDPPSGLPIRTLSDYMVALRMHHLRLAERPPVSDPFAENLESTFSVVQEGATVADSARLHDSVVLRGGRVAAGAIVVRSVICAGATARPNQRVVDRMLTGPNRQREGRAEG